MNGMIETVALGQGTAFGNDIINLIMQSGMISKLVLIILLVFSLGSWGVMLDKWLQIRRDHKASEKFMKLFKQSASYNDAMKGLKNLHPDPLAKIFMSAYKIVNQSESADTTGTKRNLSFQRVEMAIDDAILVESQLLEKRISFLGTCGSVTPFIGLFGTVWGIINAFQGISIAGSASIVAVAPGIAESLIATAAGLAAAIPAVIGYNYFLGRIRKCIALYERFRTNLLSGINLS